MSASLYKINKIEYVTFRHICSYLAGDYEAAFSIHTTKISPIVYRVRECSLQKQCLERKTPISGGSLPKANLLGGPSVIILPSEILGSSEHFLTLPMNGKHTPHGKISKAIFPSLEVTGIESGMAPHLHFTGSLANTAALWLMTWLLFMVSMNICKSLGTGNKRIPTFQRIFFPLLWCPDSRDSEPLAVKTQGGGWWRPIPAFQVKCVATDAAALVKSREVRPH